MRVIIAGSRTLDDPQMVCAAIAASGFDVTEVVCGCAQGVDIRGYFWSVQNDIPCTKFPADWRKHGKAAGPIRNRKMAEYADALIAVWDGKSRGTRHMIEVALRLGLKVFVHQTNKVHPKRSGP